MALAAIAFVPETAEAQIQNKPPSTEAKVPGIEEDVEFILVPPNSDPGRIQPGGNIGQVVDFRENSTTQPTSEERIFGNPLAPGKLRPILPPPPPGLANGALQPILKVRFSGFRFRGNRAFSGAALRKLAETTLRKTLRIDPQGQVIRASELETVREALTRKYIDAGYINSGAVLKREDCLSGLITFTIIEGKLARVQFPNGNGGKAHGGAEPLINGEKAGGEPGHEARFYRPWWLQQLFFAAAGRPLNYDRLKTAIELLQQGDTVERIQADLQPGDRVGEAVLEIQHLREFYPVRLGLEFNNSRPPSVGAEIVEMKAEDRNVLGFGDRLALTWGPLHTGSESLGHWTFRGGENVGGSYQFPLTPWRTTLELQASKTDSAIVQQPFSVLNLQSATVDYGVTLRHPIYESLNHLFDISVAAEQEREKTKLLGQPFDLSPGADNGVSQVFLVRLAGEYVNRTPRHVIALRSTFNLGLDALGATRHDQVPPGGLGEAEQKLPDGRFFSWVGQAQWVQRLAYDFTMKARVNAQLSDEPLLALEQFSIGGLNSVRGYRENQLLRDNGVTGSIEVQKVIWKGSKRRSLVTLATFFDIGTGWNTVKYIGRSPASIDDDSRLIASAGVGLIVTPREDISCAIYWGYPLEPSETVKNGHNLQDYGLHFVLSLQLDPSSIGGRRTPTASE